MIAAIEEHVIEIYTSGRPEHQEEDSRPPASPLPSQSAYVRGGGRADGIGTDFVFALAECEAIMEAVQAVENLLDICKALYGTADFIQASESGIESSISASEYSVHQLRSGGLS